MRPINILSAPTNLGNRPYEDDGTARLTHLGPQRLLEKDLIARLAARDLGVVPAAGYRDFERPRGGIRNEDLVLDQVRSMAVALESSDDFVLVLGGDCSVLLGSLLGLGRNRDLGLVFIDGHDDFNTIESSDTGAVAGMDLALATGRGRSELARLRGKRPLVRDENVVTIGIREGDLNGSRIRSATTADEAMESLGERDFFVHVDVDVLDPSFMPFVDSPVEGGLDPNALVNLLVPLVQHPRAVGMEMTIYDPRHDYDGRGAELLVRILERSVMGS